MKYEGVVVLFHPEQDLLDNIKSYITELDKLYVIDNTPEVDNSNMFKNIKKIKYIPLKENKGIAYALNIGAKEALKDKADWLLTMDQDSSFENNALKNMKEFITNYSSDKFYKEMIGAKFESVGIVSPYHMTKRNENIFLVGFEKPLEVMTSGNLVNLKAYQKVKGFKDWLFIDCVDFDFCLNLRNHNYEIIQLNFCRLKHGLGNIKEKRLLNKKIYADNHSAFRRYFIARNRHYLYDLYNKDFPDYCKLELKQTRKELIKIWMFEKNKIKKTKAIYRGYRDYKKGIKGDGTDEQNN